MISKQFHHQLRVSERLSLVGPPDNMREHVVAASKKLKMGDFQGCFELIVNEKMRNKVCVFLLKFITVYLWVGVRKAQRHFSKILNLSKCLFK